MYSLNHPHIIKLVNHFETSSHVYLLMEFAPGGHVYNKMLSSPNRRLPEKMAAKVIFELGLALHYIHTKSIIHRDIKPENILLGKDNCAKLADFGWSNFEEKSKKRKTYCGTVDYLAPEMADRNHKHNHMIDIWSLGVLIFELLTGKAPFSPEEQQGTTMTKLERATKQNIIKLNYQFPSDFPLYAKDLVKKVLQLDPKKRLTAE